MKYMGSKARHAQEILSAVMQDIGTSGIEYCNWVEPFVGGANMIDKVSMANRFGNDINEDLIEMFKAVQRGWVPPDTITKGEYDAVRKGYGITSPELRAFVAIGCSYSGKWWGGYARGNSNNGTPRNYCMESKRNLLSQNIKGVVFTAGNYFDMYIPDQSIIYCDPPYIGTTKYKDRFDHSKFWQWCNEMVSKGHKVFVSEYVAPKDWKCIWSKMVNNSLTKETGSKQGVEKLFTKI